MRQFLGYFITQRFYIFKVFIKILGCVFQCRRHTHYCRNILCTRAFAALLRAALNKSIQLNTLFGVKHARAFRSVEFMRRERKHINILLFNVYFNMPRCLNCVGVEKHAFFMT